MSTEMIIGIVSVVFGGGGVWAFITTMRGATSKEYQSFVGDLQAERKDRQDAIKRLEKRIARQDARIRRQDRRIAMQDVEFAEWQAHVGRLEDEITRLGGTPPSRPHRLRITEAGEDEVDEDDAFTAEDEPPAPPPPPTPARS